MKLTNVVQSSVNMKIPVGINLNIGKSTPKPHVRQLREIPKGLVMGFIFGDEEESKAAIDKIGQWEKESGIPLLEETHEWLAGQREHHLLESQPNCQRRRLL